MANVCINVAIDDFRYIIIALVTYAFTHTKTFGDGLIQVCINSAVLKSCEISCSVLVQCHATSSALRPWSWVVFLFSRKKG